MLYLLDRDVGTVKWNGIPLHEADSAVVKETLNGDFVLVVRYPITDSGIYQLIKEDMLIKAPVPVLGPQLFRIKNPVENDDSLDITAYHISDDVMYRSIRPMSIDRQACGVALSQMVQNAKTDLGNFSFTSDIMDSHTFNTEDSETLYSILLDGKHSIVGTWEGELVRDNFALSIKRSRGADRGVIITTHKNLKAYQRSKDSGNVVTRIHARSTFRAEGAETDTVLTVTVDSPLISSYPYINEKEYENNNAKSVDELRKWAEAKFKNEGIDKVSDAIEIEAYELDGQVVHLGDIVNIKSRKHNVDIYKKAIAYEFNCLANDSKGEYISITFDDKAGVGGSGASGGISSVAEAILGVSQNAQEIAVERAIKNANQAFDAEFAKQVEEFNDGIEQAQANAEVYADNIKQTILAQMSESDRQYQIAQQAQDQQIAESLRVAGASTNLANTAKNLAEQAKAELTLAKQSLGGQITQLTGQAGQLERSLGLIRTDVTSQAQSILAQAQRQTELTSRVVTVETIANGTKSTVTELSKMLTKATGDIASVSSRTKTVEDTLTQTRTQYESLTQTVSGHTGQIDSVSRRTATIEAGLTGLQERFENIRVGATNYIRDFGFANGHTFNNNQSVWRYERIEDGTARSGYHIKATCTQAGWGGFHKALYDLRWARYQGRVMTYSVDIKTSKSVRMRLGAEAFSKSLQIFDATTDWQRFISTDTVGYKNFYSFPFYTDGVQWQVGDVIYLRDPQLEDGNIATTPHAAEEDLRSDLATYKRTAEESSVDLSRQIQLTDGKAAEAKSYAQQIAGQLSTRLTSLETYKDGESIRASQYFAASRDETARQVTALRTAVTDGYVAKAKYEEDARGVTQRFESLQVGGQNLVSKTDKAFSMGYGITNTIWLESAKRTRLNFGIGINRAIASEILPQGAIFEGQNVVIRRGQTYTQSIKISTDATFLGNGDLRLTWFGREVSTNIVEHRPYPAKIRQIGTNEYLVWCTVPWTRPDITLRPFDIFNLHTAIDFRNTGSYIEFYHPKLEVGNFPTDWSLSIEDQQTYTETKIAEYRTTVDGRFATMQSETIPQAILASKQIKDTRNDNQTPQWYWSNYPKQTVEEFKIASVIGLANESRFAVLTTNVQWDNDTGGKVKQTAKTDRATYERYGTGSTWDPWVKVANMGDLANYTTRVDFQRVQETSQLYERIIGSNDAGIASNVARMAMTSSLFQTEVTKYSNATTNLVVDSNYYRRARYHSNGISSNDVSLSAGNVANAGTLTIKVRNQSVDKYAGILVPMYLTKILQGDKFTVRCEVRVLNDAAYPLNRDAYLEIKRHTGNLVAAAVKLADATTPKGSWVTIEQTVTARTTIDLQSSNYDGVYVWLRQNGAIEVRNIMVVAGEKIGPFNANPGDSGEISLDAVTNRVSQLGGSWAVQNLTSAGTILNQFNLLANGTNRIDGRLTHITGQTLIDNGVIKSAMIGSLDAGKITSGYLSAARIASEAITADKIKVDQALFTKLMADEALFKQLFAKNAFITQVQAVTLSASKISGGVLSSKNGETIFNLDEGILDLYKNGTIRFHTGSNAIYRQDGIGVHTAFLNFDTVDGHLYAGFGVTSSSEGLNSRSTGRFTGVRCFRTSKYPNKYERHDNGVIYRGSHETNKDEIDVVGDYIRLIDDFHKDRGVLARPVFLPDGRWIDLIKLAESVEHLWNCWGHAKNGGMNPPQAIMDERNRYQQYFYTDKNGN